MVFSVSGASPKPVFGVWCFGRFAQARVWCLVFSVSGASPLAFVKI